MKTTQNTNFLTLYETPGCLWFIGLFFMLVGGIFVYGALGGLKDYQTQSPWMLAAALLMGSAGVGVGFWIIYGAPLTKVVVDHINDELTITKRGLFGKRETIYTFEEIKYFRLIEDRDDEGAPIWSVGMELIDGELIKITSLPSHSEEYERKYIFQTNEFMRKQLPATEMILDFADEQDDEIS